MRIILLHNYYQQEGSEDTVVANERELLAERGNDVKLYTVSNLERKGITRTLRTAWQSSYSTKAKVNVAAEITHYQPDLVHIHNFFPIFFASTYDSCIETSIPVIQTLHNFRTIC